jgi:hypothetical protein
LQVLPLFHHLDDTSIGHITASVLALRLEINLRRRLEERGYEVSWLTLMGDLSQIHAVRLQLDGHNYLLRTDLEGVAHQAFLAAGVRPPLRITLLD